MPETFTLKQDCGIALMLVGGACFLGAGLFYAQNVSDAIHLRNSKARRVLAAGGAETHANLNPMRKRQSRMIALSVVALICFLIGLGLATNP
jgi:hypothetical protein